MHAIVSGKLGLHVRTKSVYSVHDALPKFEEMAMFARLVTGRSGHIHSEGYTPPAPRPGWIARVFATIFGRKRER